MGKKYDRYVGVFYLVTKIIQTAEKMYLSEYVERWQPGSITFRHLKDKVAPYKSFAESKMNNLQTNKENLVIQNVVETFLLSQQHMAF